MATNTTYVGEGKSKKPLWWWFVGGGALLLVIGGVVAYIVLRHSDKPAAPKTYNPYTETIADLQDQTPPDDPLQRAIYYGQIAQNYQQVSNWDAALRNFLEAQAIIEEKHLDDQYVFYQAIADTYHQKHDAAKEKEYLQKQLGYLQAFAKQHPDDEATAKAIQDVEKRVKAL